MSGAVPPLLQYAFVASCSVKNTGTILPYFTSGNHNYLIPFFMTSSVSKYHFLSCVKNAAKQISFDLKKTL